MKLYRFYKAEEVLILGARATLSRFTTLPVLSVLAYCVMGIKINMSNILK